MFGITEKDRRPVDVIDPELLDLDSSLYFCAHKPNINVVDGRSSFIGPGDTVVSKEHALCALLIAINAQKRTLVTHEYPSDRCVRTFPIGPKVFFDHSSLWLVLTHLFHPNFSAPLMLYVISQANDHNNYWRFFEQAVLAAFPKGKPNNERFINEYLLREINLYSLKAFLESIVYIDLPGKVDWYDIQVTRNSDGFVVCTIGRGEHDVNFEVSI